MRADKKKGEQIAAKNVDDDHARLVRRLLDGCVDDAVKAALDNSTNVKGPENSNWAEALVNYDNRLFDGGCYNAVFDNLTNVKGPENSNWAEALHSLDGLLIYANNYIPGHVNSTRRKGFRPYFGPKYSPR